MIRPLDYGLESRLGGQTQLELAKERFGRYWLEGRHLSQSATGSSRRLVRSPIRIGRCAAPIRPLKDDHRARSETWYSNLAAIALGLRNRRLEYRSPFCGERVPRHRIQGNQRYQG